jgi:YegS/Rv2252/BmrU family lipid kinase
MKIHVIVNPSSGKNQPILNTLNDVFHAHEVDWDVSLTKRSGDAIRLARQAAEQGANIVGIYGGDGSVMEAACGLMGSDTPLAIFPGGTANVMSVELGVPRDLRLAAELICTGPSQVKEVDMARLNGKSYFILRLAMGFEAEMIRKADRNLKDHAGRLSYIISGFLALGSPLNARYHFELDGEEVISEGVSCMIANTTNLGLPDVNLGLESDTSDGLLDVVVFGTADRDSLLKVMTFSLQRSENEIRQDLQKMKITQHWRARKITIEADPPQYLNMDGEIVGQTPCQVEVIPRAVRIIVPAHPALSD